MKRHPNAPATTQLDTYPSVLFVSFCPTISGTPVYAPLFTSRLILARSVAWRLLLSLPPEQNTIPGSESALISRYEFLGAFLPPSVYSACYEYSMVYLSYSNSINVDRNRSLCHLTDEMASRLKRERGT